MPPAVYGIVMVPVAALFGVVLRRTGVLASIPAAGRGADAEPARDAR